jgi:uncharacterized RDD family membrane protein YckC
MASTDYSVLTPERVSLEYDIAGIGSRGAAAIVDTAIQAVVLVVVLFGLGGGAAAANAVLPAGQGGPARAVLILGLFVLAVFVVANGYYILFEIIWSGQTPGKRLVGVRVIRENGYPIRPVDAAIRNVVRLADWLPAMYGLGVLVMLLNQRSKRLGDFAGGTIVVREGRRAAIPTTFAADSSRRGYTLSSADATLVRDFLLRRQSLHPSARADIALRLARVLSQRYHLPLDDQPDAERFLEALNP